jgi:hypothetical protein
MTRVGETFGVDPAKASTGGLVAAVEASFWEGAAAFVDGLGEILVWGTLTGVVTAMLFTDAAFAFSVA